MSSLTTPNVTSTISSLPTTFPVQYTVLYDKVPSASSLIRHDFGSVVASHNESYTLWDEKDIASSSLKSYVLDGNVNQITEELTNAFEENLIYDFIVDNHLFSNETVPEENIVVQGQGPFVSFIARVDMGNHSPPFFAGVSKLCLCGSSQDSGDEVPHDSINGTQENSVEGMQEDSVEGNVANACEFWYESVTIPLFLYKIVNSTSIDSGTYDKSAKRISIETDVVKREKGKSWKNVPVGFLTLTRNDTATTTNSTGIVVEEHMMDLKRKRRRKRIAVFILSVFALFAAFLFTQMLMQKYSDYRPIP